MTPSPPPANSSPPDLARIFQEGRASGFAGHRHTVLLAALGPRRSLGYAFGPSLARQRAAAVEAGRDNSSFPPLPVAPVATLWWPKPWAALSAGRLAVPGQGANCLLTRQVALSLPPHDFGFCCFMPPNPHEICELPPPPGLDLSLAPLARRHLDQVVAIEQASFANPWSRCMFSQELMSPLGHGLRGPARPGPGGWPPSSSCGWPRARLRCKTWPWTRPCVAGAWARWLLVSALARAREQESAAVPPGGARGQHRRPSLVRVLGFRAPGGAAALLLARGERTPSSWGASSKAGLRRETS